MSRVKAYVIFLILLVLIPPAYVGWREFYVHVVERNRPKINVPAAKVPKGLGINPLKIPINISDAHSGLDLVIVRSNQYGEIKELVKKSYEKGVQEDQIVIDLPGKKSGLREGDAKLIVTAFDRSLWSNRRQLIVEFPVDYSAPKLKVITKQHNTVRGGAELVFYEVEDDNKVLSGVKIDGGFYPGFQAKKLDADFAERPDVYFSFFPIPQSIESNDPSVRLFAVDEVGNGRSAGVNYTLRNRRAAPQTLKINRETWGPRVAELYQEYLEESKSKSPNSVFVDPDEEFLFKYHAVQNDYRALIEEQFANIFLSPKSVRFWELRFAQFQGRITGRFGEPVKVVFSGENIGDFIRQGTLILAGKGLDIRAANTGVVIFSDSLGVYGETIVIDHGFGLSSLYAHLSKREVREGDRVDRGDIIGKSGSSGLAVQNQLYFETRLYGVPVRPEEWWDGRWVKEHIDKKIERAKRILGLAIRRVLD